ncbi:hypothetical protein [Anaerobium acetethylicum]|uniref:Uncharacterized protein n=1 Tax=Anaerobium acetethylicum TaxID=1619234 RepID=A0A1D3TS20_9FIRM|nr:hypothetical protein [Anaerobium acetethylicum]SCP96576.1 hypothetical protein SAMN05421730_100599 [Anaerobium acetethylicum]
MEKTIVNFKCKDRNQERDSIVLCFVSFAMGAVISAIISNNGYDSWFVDLIPLITLAAGIIIVSKKYGDYTVDGGAEFSEESCEVRVGRKLFSIRYDEIVSLDYKSNFYRMSMKDMGYTLWIKTRRKTYKVTTEELEADKIPFRETGLYGLYDGLKTATA